MSSAPLDIPRLLRETTLAQVQHFLSVDSTNTCAKQLAGGDPGELPLLVIAEEQTAGRGRGANRWWTGSGSLAFSLLLDLPQRGLRREHGPLLALASGIAVVETVAPRLPQHTVGLHWPNDVYVEDKKLTGILVEVPSEQRAVIGIGVNTNNTLQDAPDALRPRITTMRDLTGTLHDPTEILIGVLQTLDRLVDQLPCDPTVVARRADELCLQHGQVLTVEQGSQLLTGTCSGIAADGSLLLETAAGPQHIYSGVFR